MRRRASLSRAGGHVAHQPAELAVAARLASQSPRTRRPALPQPGLGPHHRRHHPRPPPGPVLPRVGQQGVSRHEPQRGRHPAGVQRPVVRHLQRRVEPDTPPGRGRPPAEVHVLVVEEERLVEPAELPEAVAADEQAPAGHPVHRLARRLGAVGTLPPRPRQEQPGERAQQRRERPARRLRATRRGSAAGTRPPRRSGRPLASFSTRSLRRRGTRPRRSRPGSGAAPSRWRRLGERADCRGDSTGLGSVTRGSPRGRTRGCG